MVWLLVFIIGMNEVQLDEQLALPASVKLSIIFVKKNIINGIDAPAPILPALPIKIISLSPNVE